MPMMKPLLRQLAAASTVVVTVLSFSACSRTSDPEEEQTVRDTATTKFVSASPPSDAVMVDGIPTVILVAGFGKVRPDLDQRALVTMAFVEHAADGRETARVPVVLQDVRGLAPDWQRIVLSMVAGEVRRAWLPNANGGFRVVDIELQAVSGSASATK